MKSIKLGFLKIGDTFYFDGKQYKANSVSDKPINNVCCTNLETKKRIWLDVDTEVEVDK